MARACAASNARALPRRSTITISLPRPFILWKGMPVDMPPYMGVACPTQSAPPVVGTLRRLACGRTHIPRGMAGCPPDPECSDARCDPPHRYGIPLAAGGAAFGRDHAGG